MAKIEDGERFQHMLEYALKVQRFSAGRKREDLDRDELYALAMTRALEVIGEAAARVSDAGRARAPSIPWSQIAGLRNRLIHGYDTVNHDILWQIVTGDVPALVKALEPLVPSE
jgi:uncharacterized protein with HEPN domain